MRKKIVIILILFVSIILLAYSYNRKDVPQNTSVLSDRIDAVSPIPTGVGNLLVPQTWSRYSYNNDFTIAYPPKWEVAVSKDDSTVNFMTAGFHQDDDFSMPYGNSNEVTYTIFGEHDTSDMNLKNGDQFPDDTTSETLVVSNFKKIQINGLPAVEFDYYPTDNVHFIRTRISLLRNHKMYRFDATYAQTSGKQVLEEMVQSLQFVHS